LRDLIINIQEITDLQNLKLLSNKQMTLIHLKQGKLQHSNNLKQPNNNNNNKADLHHLISLEVLMKNQKLNLPKPQMLMVHMLFILMTIFKDLLGLDFGGSNQTQQTNQNTGFDFFGSGQTQTQTINNPNNQGFNQGFEGFGGQPSMNQSQGQKPQTNMNDLMGLEFGSPNPATTNTNNINTNTQVDFTNQNQTITNVNVSAINDAQVQKKVSLFL